MGLFLHGGGFLVRMTFVRPRTLLLAKRVVINEGCEAPSCFDASRRFYFTAAGLRLGKFATRSLSPFSINCFPHFLFYGFLKEGSEIGGVRDMDVIFKDDASVIYWGGAIAPFALGGSVGPNSLELGEG